MILLANGDSWTQGDNPSQTFNWNATKSLDWYDIVPGFGRQFLPHYTFERFDTRIDYKFYDSDVWPKVLGSNLKLKTWNAGRLGSSNSQIVHSTLYSLKYLQKLGHSDIFVVIGWTSMFRQHIFYQFQKNGKNFFDRGNLRPHNCDAKDIPFNNLRLFSSQFLKDVITLQNYLENNNIKYLFFNAFDHLDSDDDELYSMVNLENWIDNRLDIGHFKDYLLKKFNFKDWDKSSIFQKNHPTDKGHRAWGAYLTEYIQENVGFFN